MGDEKLYYIAEVAAELNRVPHTIRMWEYQKRLPAELLPGRDERGWRVWTGDQVTALKQWMIDEDMTPGKAFRR